jgi:hypothetical protein
MFMSVGEMRSFIGEWTNPLKWYTTMVLPNYMLLEAPL